MEGLLATLQQSFKHFNDLYAEASSDGCKG